MILKIGENGISKGGFLDLFSRKSGLNNDAINQDIQALRTYNNAVKHGCIQQTTFDEILKDSSKSAKDFATSAKGGAVNLGNYEKVVKATTASTKVLAIAEAALNAGIVLVASVLISKGLEAFDKWIHKQELAIEKANELKDSYKTTQDSLKSNKETISSISSEYEKLSRGVADNGENIALTADEYKRYTEIVTQIKDMFPSMVQGYTDEGVAILKNKGKVEELTQAYKDQKQAVIDAVIVGSDNVFKGFKAETSETSWTMSNGIAGSSKVSLEQATKLLNIMKETNGNADELFTKIYKSGNYNTKDIANLLKDAGISDFQENDESMTQAIVKNMDNISSYYNTVVAKINTSTSELKPTIFALLSKNENYTNLDASMKDNADKVINSLSGDFLSSFPDKNSMMAWIDTNVIQVISDNKNNVQKSLNSLFALDKSKMSAGEYQKQADVLIDIIAKEFEMNPVDLKVQLGMDSVDTLISEAKKKVNTAEINSAYTTQQASDKSSFVEGLSEDDLKILVKMGDIGSMSIEEITKAIDNAKKATGDLEDQTVKSADELEKEYEKANKAVSDFSSNASSIATVMKTISDGEKVDANTLLDLIAKYPQYASEILKVNDSKEQGLEIAKLLFEANKAQTLTELENYGKLLKAQEDLLATKVEYSNQPLEANTAWVEAHTKSQANDTSIDVVKGSNFEDFQKKDTGKKSDPNQDAYEKAMANHIHLHNMQLESDTDFYNAMEQANETYYKNDVDHLKDYNTNIETIYNGRNDIIKQAFEDEKTILQDANSGSIADQKKYLETLSKLNDEYYKGKTQFGKEYIATQKEIAKGQADLIKQENESQMDFVSSLKDKFDKDADDKLNALKKQNEEVDKQLEKQQHLLDLQEKEIALKHAEENSRMVVGDNGIEYRTNPDDIKNAELDVAKAKQVIEQDKTDDQISALESVKENGDAIYDVLLEMYKALTGKDVTPVKSNPEVEARLAQATTIDKDGNTLVNGMPITPLIETKTPFDINALSAFNQGNFNMSNILGDTSSRLGELGAVTNNSTNNNQGFSLNIENINVSDVATGTDIRDVVINQFPNSMRQAFGSNIRK